MYVSHLACPKCDATYESDQSSNYAGAVLRCWCTMTSRGYGRPSARKT